MLKKIFSILLLSSLLSSCGEEILTQNTLSESFGAPDLETFQYNTCAAMRFVKPPVDILFVVDNSGSTLQDSFQQIKDQIAATVSTISNEFDYHVYIAPLKPIDGDNINGYPLIVSDTNSLTQSLAHYPGLIELGSISSQTLFGDPAGNNDEHGLKRVHDVIDANRSNGIFRQNAHTVAVMISNGDDNEVVEDNDGFGTTVNESVFTDRKQSFLTLANDTLNSESFRFISLVPHTNCNSWKMGHYYKRMSQEIYDSFDYSDDNTLKNSRDLCSGNYSSLFSVVNSSIHHELVGHKYDHWKISSASETDINASEITVTKVSPNGTETNVPTGSVNGFEYLGHKTNINTRYEPDSGEPVTGLVIKLNGTARLSYPNCIKAKTVTPTEYFGYAVLPREPQVATIKVEVNGQTVPSSSSNGWTYEGYKPSTNVKVPGPENVSVEPGMYKSGYFIKMNGSAVFTNGDTINIYYKPKAL